MADQLWEYAVRLYARPGAPALLIACQDAHGADVLLLLALLGASASGRAVTDVAGLVAAAAPWRARAVLPLRALRRGLKADPTDRDGALHAALKAAELAAERAQLRLLDALIPAAGGAPIDAGVSLDAYRRLIGAPEGVFAPLLALAAER